MGVSTGVSQKLMTRALSKAVNIEENILAHRLMGQWSPQSTTFEELILNPNPEDQISQPYPFSGLRHRRRIYGKRTS